MSQVAGKTFVLTSQGTLSRHTTNIGERLGDQQPTDKRFASHEITEVKVNLVMPRVASDALQKQLSIRRETKIRLLVKYDRSDALDDYAANSLYIGDHTEPKTHRKMKVEKNANTVNIKLWT